MSNSSRPTHAASAQPRTLRAVAVFKIGKALLLATLGLGALRLVDPQAMHHAEHWVAALGAGALDRRAVQFVLDKLTGLSEQRLHVLGIGGFFFAALFAVEGVGLWLGKRWAEFLTVIATVSLIPLEIYELTQRATWTRVSALVINLALAAYLIWLLRRPSPAGKSGAVRRRKVPHKARVAGGHSS